MSGSKKGRVIAAHKGGRTEQLNIRLSPQELESLHRLATKPLTQADIICLGIRLLANMNEVERIELLANLINRQV